jgi:HK97 family phage prohead protease
MIERRVQVSVRAEGTERQPVLSGYAAVWNKLSKKIYTKAGNYFYERLSPYCMTRAISQEKTVANLHHDMTKPLGTQRSGTLKLTEDSRGLLVRCDINPNVSYAMDAWHNAGTRLSAMSFAFQLAEDDGSGQRSGDAWDELSDDEMDELEETWRASRRTIREIDSLSDVAFLTEGTGAYDDAFCYQDLRTAFPEGVPNLIEKRCSTRIIKPTNEQVSETEKRRLRMKRLRESL